MSNLANSENPDEMPHNASFYHGLHCLQKQNGLQGVNIWPHRKKTCLPDFIPSQSQSTLLSY